MRESCKGNKAKTYKQANMSARTQAIYLSRFGLVFYPQTIAFHLIFLFSERRKRDKNHTNCGLQEVLSILLAWVSLQN